MPPKEKEAKKSVSFKGTDTQKKNSAPAHGASPDAKQNLVSNHDSIIVDVASAPAPPSDGATEIFHLITPGESLDNEGFVPPLERHEHRPSGDDGEVLTMDDEDGHQKSRRDDVVDIDELPVDDDGCG